MISNASECSPPPRAPPPTQRGHEEGRPREETIIPEIWARQGGRERPWDAHRDAATWGWSRAGAASCSAPSSPARSSTSSSSTSSATARRCRRDPPQWRPPPPPPAPRTGLSPGSTPPSRGASSPHTAPGLSAAAPSRAPGTRTPSTTPASAAADDPYHPASNPSGIIQLGLTKNHLSLDLVRRWMEEHAGLALLTPGGDDGDMDLTIRGLARYQTYDGILALKMVEAFSRCSGLPREKATLKSIDYQDDTSGKTALRCVAPITKGQLYSQITGSNNIR